MVQPSSAGSFIHWLCEDDLAVVYDELFGISTKWYDLGLQFGIKVAELDKIAEQNPANVNRSLRIMLTKWLRTADKPSWKHIVEILRSNTIQEVVLANEMESRRCDVPKRSLSDSANTSRDPTPLFSHNPQPLVLPEHVQSPLHSHTGHDPSNTNAEDSSTTMEFPYLNMEGLDDAEKQRLKHRLRREYEDIAAKYAQMRNDIRMSLISRGIPVKELVALLMDYPATQTRKIPKLFEERFEELHNASDINDVFFILKDYSSFFYYKITAYIAKNLGTENDKQNLQQYAHELSEYCKRSVFECPASEYSTAKPNVVMKVDPVVKKLYTMESVNCFLEDIERILNIKVLQLCTIEKGCLELSYHIPLFIQAVVFPLSSEQKETLQSFGVIRLTYDFKQVPRSLDQQQQFVTSHRFDEPVKMSLKQDNNSLKISMPISKQSLPLDPSTPMQRRESYGNQQQQSQSQNKHSSFPERVTVEFSQQNTTPCIKYMLLGDCPARESCQGHHEMQIPNPSVGYVSDPVGRLPNFRRAVGVDKQAPNRKWYTVTLSDREPEKEVRIVAEDAQTLDYAKKEVLQKLNKSHTVHDTYFIQCFIHPQAVDTGNLALRIQPVKSVGPRTKYMAIWDKIQTIVFEDEEKDRDTVETLSELNPEETSASELLENPEQSSNKLTTYISSAHFRITRDYKVMIEKQLMDALKWIHSKKHFLPKLEGRFGKNQWTKLTNTILNEELISLSNFVRFLFKNDNYKRYFVTEVRENSLDILEKSSLEDSGSFVETYDVKLSVLNKGRLDVRVKFTDGKPEVVSVKVDEQKVATFDILCLHRY